jgi:hypothetical protein
LAVAWAAERERSGNGVLLARADGEQQRVVRRPCAVAEHAVSGAVDRLQRTDPELEPALGGAAAGPPPAMSSSERSGMRRSYGVGGRLAFVAPCARTAGFPHT